jgi:hypothetical protein
MHHRTPREKQNKEQTHIQLCIKKRPAIKPEPHPFCAVNGRLKRQTVGQFPTEQQNLMTLLRQGCTHALHSLVGCQIIAHGHNYTHVANLRALQCIRIIRRRNLYLAGAMQSSLEIRNGILLAFLGFLWLLMEKALGLHSTYLDLRDFIFWLIIFIPLTGFYYTLKYKRDKHLDGSITFLQCLRSVLILVTSSTIATLFFVWLYVALVNPNYLTIRMNHELNIIKAAQLNLESELLKETEIKSGFGMMNYLIRYFISTIIICSVLGLAISMLIRKKPINKVGPNVTTVQ